MKLADNLSLSRYFPGDLFSAVGAFAKTPFRYLDFNTAETAYLASPDYLGLAAKIRAFLDKKGIGCIQAHSPVGVVLGDGDEARRNTELLARVIRFVAVLGAGQIVVHDALCGNVTQEEHAEKNASAFRRLIPVAEETGVRVLLENTCPQNAKGQTAVTTGAELRMHVEAIGHPLFRAVWDVGHAHLTRHATGHKQGDGIRGLGPLLAGLHVHDNIRFLDDHMVPFSGVVDYDDVMEALLEIGYRGYFTFEADCFPLPAGWRDSRPDARLAAASLRLALLAKNYLYECGREILSAYDCFEE